MLKQANESVIVVFSKSIVYMMSQDEVKSGNTEGLRNGDWGRWVMVNRKMKWLDSGS